MNPEYPIFGREDLLEELPTLQENEAFFRQKAWEAIQAGDQEAASNYIDIHAEAELKADEVEAHVMNIDFDDRRNEWIAKNTEKILKFGSMAVAAFMVSESYEPEFTPGLLREHSKNDSRHILIQENIINSKEDLIPLKSHRLKKYKI
jgi:hypothetical protein